MIEARRLVAAEKFELLELLYRRLPDGTRLKPSTKALLYLFADCERALHWSNARIAETLGYSCRTIVTAMNELREWGILTSVRRQRETSTRFLWLDAAREITAKAVSSIRKTCAFAVAALRADPEVKHGARSNHRFKRFGVTEAVSHLKTAAVSDLTPQFRRLMPR